MLTIMIPTMNRSDFLIRLLNYYADTGYKHWIFIGDSSNPYHVEKTKNAIKNIGSRLKIIYQEYPGLNDAECMQQIVKRVSTPYVVFVADDDFLVPNGLKQCVGFLESNQDYNSVHGVANVFTLQTNGPYGKFASSYNYRLPSIEAKTASQRILDHLSDYSVTLFCVHRTENWKEMFKYAYKLTDKAFRGELLPCCISVIQGKVKQIDSFYLARQNHNTRYELPDIHEWLNSPNWQQSYDIFRDCLAEELARQDDINLNKAKDIIEKAFSSYLNMEKNNRIHAIIGKTIRYFPGINRMIMYFKNERSGNLSLPKLLNLKSPYHSDFMPVYRAVTTPAKLIK